MCSLFSFVSFVVCCVVWWFAVVFFVQSCVFCLSLGFCVLLFCCVDWWFVLLFVQWCVFLFLLCSCELLFCWVLWLVDKLKPVTNSDSYISLFDTQTLIPSWSFVFNFFNRRDRGKSQPSFKYWAHGLTQVVAVVTPHLESNPDNSSSLVSFTKLITENGWTPFFLSLFQEDKEDHSAQYWPFTSLYQWDPVGRALLQ